MSVPWRVLSILAWRNLWRNHRRTTIMLAAIAIGVWAMIFLTAVLRGMVDDMVQGSIDTLPGHVQIHHAKYRDDPSRSNSIEPPDASLLAVLSSREVHAWSQRVKVPAMISSERDARGVTLVGIEPLAETQMTPLAQQIVEGRYLLSNDDKGLIIGAKLADRLETRLGKRVVVMSEGPDNNVADRGFRIVGIYQAKLQATEEMYVYTSREVAQDMLELGAQVSEIAALGHNYRDVDGVYHSIKNAAPDNVQVLPWYELDRYTGTALGMMDGFVLVWMVVVFLALSFGLVNTLVMAIFERVREIGMMLALGMRPSAILFQILLESFLLLGIGLLIGDLLAWASTQALSDGIDVSMVAEGMEMAGYGSVIHLSLQAKDVLLANTVVIVLGILASILPAWRAAHYEPVEAINKT
jgi:ABC-type lipoprotein release transport system permease subunit